MSNLTSILLKDISNWLDILIGHLYWLDWSYVSISFLYVGVNITVKLEQMMQFNWFGTTITNSKTLTDEVRRRAQQKTRIASGMEKQIYAFNGKKLECIKRRANKNSKRPKTLTRESVWKIFEEVDRQLENMGRISLK